MYETTNSGLLSPKHKVMVIDDNTVNLQVARKALSGTYTVIPATSGETALILLEKVLPSLILLDIQMPEMNGFEAIRLLKRNKTTQNIPVIFLTAIDDNVKEMEGLQLGAVDYIKKPFSTPLLVQRVNLQIALVEQQKELKNYNDNLTNLVYEKTKTIEELHHAIIFALSDLIDNRDGLTGGHVKRTQEYLMILTSALMQSGEYVDELEGMDLDMWIESAQLHDIGKVGIPDDILKKPGGLTEEEFEVIKTHTTIGENALNRAMEQTSNRDFLQYAATVAASHHEWWDGTGYPYALKGLDIPLIGRLLAIVDVYDALVSDRPYKKAFSHEVAVEIIIEESGTHFDPVLIEIFKQCLSFFENVDKGTAMRGS